MSTGPTLAHIRRKVRQIGASELTLSGKIAYVTDLALGAFRSSAAARVRKYRLTGGASVVLRENSTDRKVFDEIFLEKIYDGSAMSYETQARHQDARHTSPAPILIDLGANIGLSAIALARQLQPAGIVAVEPDPGNFAMLRENLRRAGWSDRAKTLRAFVGAERGLAELIDSGNGAWGMRMGVPARTGVPVWRIEDLVEVARHVFDFSGERPRIILKCDIEGAEAQLFRTLSRWEHLIDRVILELHTEFLPVESLRAYLDTSNYEWHIEGNVPPDAVLAVLTLRRGEHKTVPQTQHATVA